MAGETIEDEKLSCTSCGSSHMALGERSDASPTAANVQCRRCKAWFTIEIADGGADEFFHTVKSTVVIRRTLTTPGRPQPHRRERSGKHTGLQAKEPARLPAEDLAAMAERLHAAGVHGSGEEVLARNREPIGPAGPTWRQRAALQSLSGLNGADLVALGAMLGRLAPECATFADEPDPLGCLNRSEVGGLFDLAQTLRETKLEAQPDAPTMH